MEENAVGTRFTIEVGAVLLHAESGVCGKVSKLYPPGTYRANEEDMPARQAVVEFEDGNRFLAPPDEPAFVPMGPELVGYYAKIDELLGEVIGGAFASIANSALAAGAEEDEPGEIFGAMRTIVGGLLKVHQRRLHTPGGLRDYLERAIQLAYAVDERRAKQLAPKQPGSEEGRDPQIAKLDDIFQRANPLRSERGARSGNVSTSPDAAEGSPSIRRPLVPSVLLTASSN